MQILRLSFKSRGLVSTLPVAHTFFGTFCWGIRLFYGEEELKKFLRSYEEGNLPLLFSSLLPERNCKLYFPKPASLGLNSDLESFHKKPVMAYRLQKKFKSVEYISEDDLRVFLEGGKVELGSFYTEDEEEKFYYKVEIPHASINRITCTTTGDKFFFEVAYAIPAFSILVQVKNWIFQDRPEELLPAIFNFLPVGGNKSTGMGLFEVRLEEVPEWLKSFTRRGNFFYSLSDFMCDDSLELENSYYDVEVKRPAVENYFRRVNKLWKGPLLLIKAGAVMKVNTQKEYYGKLEKFSDDVYHYGYAFPLYIRESRHVEV